MKPLERPSQQRKKIILVFAEGEVTEVEYLAHLRREHNQKISIKVETPGGPKTLVDAALDAAKTERFNKRRKLSTYDAIWVMFDHDDFPGVKAQVTRARDAGIGVAFSNPCIELWFLLHFQECRAWLDRQEAKRSLSAFLSSGKSVTWDDWDKLMPAYRKARGRARSLTGMHRNNLSWTHESPSSTVWELADTIIQ